MTKGIKVCPKCEKPNGARAKNCIECGFDFTLPPEYDGPGAEKQTIEEKPEVPAAAEELEIKKPEPAPVEESVSAKLLDTQDEEIEQLKKDIALYIEANKSLCQTVSEQEKANECFSRWCQRKTQTCLLCRPSQNFTICETSEKAARVGTPGAGGIP